GGGAWIELLGRAGGAKELQRLFDQVLSNGFDEPGALRALAALNEASRLRNTRPSNGLENVGKLLNNPSEPFRAEAVRLVGQWTLRQFVPDLLKLAGDTAASVSLRHDAFESLRSLSMNKNPEIFAGLRPLTSTNHEPDIRRQAAVILAGIDAGKALPEVVGALMAAPNETEAEGLWRGL